MSTDSKPRHCTRWMVPGTAVAAGVAYLVVGLAGGQRGFGLAGFAIMLVVAAGSLVAGRYSETMKGLLDRRDERINALDRDATVAMGGVLMAAILVLGLIEIARGEDGSPYFELAALGAVAYLGALLWLRWRH